LAEQLEAGNQILKKRLQVIRQQRVLGKAQFEKQLGDLKAQEYSLFMRKENTQHELKSL